MDRGLVLRAVWSVCPHGHPVRAACRLLPALHFEGRQGVGGPLRAFANSAIFSRTLGVSEQMWQVREVSYIRSCVRRCLQTPSLPLVFLRSRVDRGQYCRMGPFEDLYPYVSQLGAGGNILLWG